MEWPSKTVSFHPNSILKSEFWNLDLGNWISESCILKPGSLKTGFWKLGFVFRNLEVWILKFGLRNLGFRIQVLKTQFWKLDFENLKLVLKFGLQNSGFENWVSKIGFWNLKFWNLGFEIWASEFGFWKLGFENGILKFEILKIGLWNLAFENLVLKIGFENWVSIIRFWTPGFENWVWYLDLDHWILKIRVLYLGFKKKKKWILKCRVWNPDCEKKIFWNSGFEIIWVLTCWGLEIRVLKIGCRESASEIWILKIGFRKLEFEIQNLKVGIWKLEFGIWNSEFGIQNLEFGIWKLGFESWDLKAGIWSFEILVFFFLMNMVGFFFNVCLFWFLRSYFISCFAPRLRSALTSVGSLRTRRRSCAGAGCRWGHFTPSPGTTTPNSAP